MTTFTCGRDILSTDRSPICRTNAYETTNNKIRQKLASQNKRKEDGTLHTQEILWIENLCPLHVPPQQILSTIRTATTFVVDIPDHNRTATQAGVEV